MFINGNDIAKEFLDSKKTNSSDNEEHDDKHMDLVTKVHDCLYDKNYGMAKEHIEEHMKNMELHKEEY